ncbi:MAG TPA: serine hydrolase domain-containing protein [Rudaea sp.]|nr:serine hydrolase domain-containing protein [Rudaea sp.]
MKISLFALCLLASVARATAALPDAYREAAERAVRDGAYRDLAIGWIDGGERSTAFYGEAKAGSAYELGAVTEVFTGLLLAEAAVEGKIRFQMPLREALPGFAFADPALGALTFERLITHHSGLPPVPPNLFPVSLDDPYAGYGETQLGALLANGHVDAAGGYSTLDAGVLARAVSAAYAAKYTNVLGDRVLTPLGLKHTGFDDDGVLAGHARGGAAPHWHFGALAASAGLRSTTADLLDFLQANLRPEASPLRAALLLARQPREMAQGNGVGLGWNVHDSSSGGQTWPVLWRASSTAGFSAFIGFRTDRQQALVLLDDTDVDVSALGMAWLEGDAAPVVAAPSIAPSAISLGDYTGLYQVHGGGEVIVRATDGLLSAQLRGQPAWPLRALADDVFETMGGGFGISFQREAGRVVSAIVSREGANVLVQRLSARAPHIARAAIAMGADALGAFVGDYRLAPDTLARFSVAGGGLVLQTTGHTATSLVAYAPNRFVCADDACLVAFRRDDAGKIVAATIDFAGQERDAARVAWVAP